MLQPVVDHGPVCVIVTGLPGAGKSTVTKLVAGQLPRAARLSGDVVGEMIVGGRVWALGQPAEEAAAQVELIHQNLASLAQNMTSAGFTAVVDVVLETRAELTALTASLTCDWLLVVLAPTIDVCRARNAGRAEDERWSFKNYEGLEAQMKKSFDDTVAGSTPRSSHRKKSPVRSSGGLTTCHSRNPLPVGCEKHDPVVVFRVMQHLAVEGE